MSVTGTYNPPHSPTAVRYNIPIEAPSSFRGSNNKCSSSPRLSRNNVTPAPPSQGFPSSSRILNDAAPIKSSVGIAEVRLKTVVAGRRRVVSSLKNTKLSPRIYMEVGLENLGNTCFMNSSLQCLLHIQPLVAYFLATNVCDVLNEKSPMKGLLASSFAQLVKDVFNASAGSSIAPMAFQKVIGHFAPHLLDHQQQDCQEFLRFLLDGMSEDLCRKKASVEDVDNQNQPRSPKLASLRLVSSRTRARIHHTRSQSLTGVADARTLSTGADYLEESTKSEDQKCLLEQSGSFVPRVWNDDVSSPKYDDNNEESPSRKATSASKLREQVVLASRNMISIPNLADDVQSELIQSCKRFESLSTRDLRSSRVSPVEESVGTVPTDTSGCDTALETNSEWSERADGVLKGVVQDDDSHCEYDSCLSKLNSETIVKGSSYDITLPYIDTETSGSRTPNGHRMRTTFQKLLGPISFTSKDRVEKASKAPSRVQSPVLARHLRSPSLGSTSQSPIRVPSPMNFISRGSKKSPLSGSSSVASTARLSDIKKVRSADDSLEKNGSWSHKPHPGCEDKDAVIEAEKAWLGYLKMNESVVTDIFAGQLQSTIECLTCRSRSFCFDPFLDLSVPIPKKHGNKSKWRRQFSLKEQAKCPLEECIEKFAGEEILDGDNMYTCLKCKEKRKCTKKLSIFKYPRVLVIHIKRFRYSEVSREKISTDVMFPIKGLDLGPYLSSDRPSSSSSATTTTPSARRSEASNNLERQISTDSSLDTQCSSSVEASSSSQGRPYPDDGEDSPVPQTSTPPDSCYTYSSVKFDANLLPPIYDLLGVSHHCGTLSGGHYVAHVDTNAAARGSQSPGQQEADHTEQSIGREKTGNHDRFTTQDRNAEAVRSEARWMCFNDELVTPASPADIIGPSAYVLFYRLRE